MQEPAEEMIVHNLIEALERLRQDLDSVELWTAALGCFQRPDARIPAEQPIFAVGYVQERAIARESLIAARAASPMSFVLLRTRPIWCAGGGLSRGENGAREHRLRSLLSRLKGPRFGPKKSPRETLKNGDLTIS